MTSRPGTEAAKRRSEEIIECSRVSSDPSSETFQSCLTENCCYAQFDGQLCWPLTRPNTTISRPCEQINLEYMEEVDGKLAFHTCTDGTWLETDYSECLLAATYQKKLLMAQIMLWTYVVVGAISLISLVIAFYVFKHYRALQCNRITVHRHFVFSFIIRHTLLLMILNPHFYLLGSMNPADERHRRVSEDFKRTLFTFQMPSYEELLAYMSRNATHQQPESEFESESESAEFESDSEMDSVNDSFRTGNSTDDTKEIIEIYLYKILDSAEVYSFLCTVSWMFIEGFYLYYRTVAVFKSEAPFRLFYFIGWGLPAVITAVWVTFVELYEKESKWTLETKDIFRWITLGPFLAAITANIFFLTHIIFILVRKLRLTRAMEMSHTKKAIRGILLILPLLGITNILFLVDPSDSKSQAMEILYRVTNAFLQSAQGFSVAVIYCFTNQDVQSAVKKRWFRYRQTQSVRSHRRSTMPAEAMVSADIFQRIVSHRRSFVVPLRNGSLTSRSYRFVMEEVNHRQQPYRNGSARSLSRQNGNSRQAISARNIPVAIASGVENMSWNNAERAPE